jgi:hypothetical protein
MSMFSRREEGHWCHYCRSVIRNNSATVRITLKRTRNYPRFWFHMDCHEKWCKDGAPMLPGAMTMTAKRVGLPLGPQKRPASLRRGR